MTPRNWVIDPGYLQKLDIMDAREAAAYLRTSPSTLAKYRHFGGGPSFIRQSSRKTLYRRVDLDAWLEERTYGSTSEYREMEAVR